MTLEEIRCAMELPKEKRTYADIKALSASVMRLWIELNGYELQLQAEEKELVEADIYKLAEADE